MLQWQILQWSCLEGMLGTCCCTRDEDLVGRSIPETATSSGRWKPLPLMLLLSPFELDEGDRGQLRDDLLLPSMLYWLNTIFVAWKRFGCWNSVVVVVVVVVVEHCAIDEIFILWSKIDVNWKQNVVLFVWGTKLKICSFASPIPEKWNTASFFWGSGYL